MAEVQKDSDRIITHWGGRWRTQNCTAWSSESLTANTSVWISLTSSKACWLLLYKKILINPTETRTTTWQGINPLDNGIMVPQGAWTPAKLVPELSLFWLCRNTMAMLIFCPQKSKAAFLSLPPIPLWSHRCHCTGLHPQTKTATTQARVQVSFRSKGSPGH